MNSHHIAQKTAKLLSSTSPCFYSEFKFKILIPHHSHCEPGWGNLFLAEDQAALSNTLSGLCATTYLSIIKQLLKPRSFSSIVREILFRPALLASAQLNASDRCQRNNHAEFKGLQRASLLRATER